MINVSLSSSDQSKNLRSRPLLQKLVDSIVLVGVAVLTIVCGQSLNRALQVYFIENSGLKHSSVANFLLAGGVCILAILVLTLGFGALLDGTTGDVRGCTNWDQVAKKIAKEITKSLRPLDNHNSPSSDSMEPSDEF